MKDKLLKLKEFFLSRPKEDWCINVVSNGSQCCAIGHIYHDYFPKDEQKYVSNYTTSRSILFKGVSNWLSRMISVTRDNSSYGSFHEYDENFLIHVNNGCYNEYPQENPRDRVIAAIDDGIKIWDAQHPEYKDITKQLAVLPTEEVPDILLIKEMV